MRDYFYITLAAIITFVFLTGCTSMPQRIEVSAKPIEKPNLVLPNATTLRLSDVEWIVITKENAEEVFAGLESSRKDAALLGLTDEGYKVISTNHSDIMAYIQQQNAIIAAYKSYYEESEQAIEDANDAIEEQNETPEEDEGVLDRIKFW